MGEGLKELRMRVAELHGESTERTERGNRQVSRDIINQLESATKAYCEAASKGTATPQQLDRVIIHLYSGTKFLLLNSQSN
jgi:hypothetical protein